MRDTELSLEKRKPIALLVCGLLLGGVIFTLGLLIGRKTAALQPPAQVAGDLALLDAQARSAPPARPQAPPKTETAPGPRSAEPTEKAEPVRIASIVPAPARAPIVVPPAAVRPVQVSAPAQVVLTSPPRELGAYTVQLGATQEKTDAARLEGRARGAGLKAYVQEADLGARGTWYRVRVGAFRDKDSANRFRKDVERELRIAAVVMPAR